MTASKMNEAIAEAWDEWESSTGKDANNPNDFVDWAIENRKLAFRPEDVKKIYRRRVTDALRQVIKVNPEGTAYRAKQCVTLVDGGQQMSLWFDVDKGGTASLRKKAVRQRREAIANDVYRAKSDVDHMNFAYPDDDPIQFEMDFTEDYEERKAFELLEAKEKKKVA